MKNNRILPIFLSLMLTATFLVMPNAVGIDLTSSEINPSTFSPGDNNGINDTATINVEYTAGQDLYVNIFNQSSGLIQREDQTMTESPSGTYVYTWNGKDDSNTYVNDGTYIVRVSDNIEENGDTIGTVIVNTTKPSSPSISISGGATYTTTRNVDLTISATGASKMKVSNYADYTGASWISYSTSKSWQLTSGDGIKTVYINFKTTSGANISTSDTITLDTTLADPSISINSGSDSTNDRNVTLTITANGATRMKVDNNTDFDNMTSWISIATSYNFTLPEGVSSPTVYLRVKDAANNQKTASDSITVDTTPPTGLTLSINDDESYTNSTSVTLSLSANGGPSTMYISNNGATWESYDYATSKAWTLSETGDGTKTVYFKAKDAAGNNATAVTSTITLDTTAPSVVTLSSPSAGATVSSQTPTFSWTNPNNASKTRQFFIEILSGGSVTQSSYLNSSTTSYTASTLEEGVYTWRVTVYDLANNSARTTQRSFTVSVDGIAIPSPKYPSNGAKVNSSAPSMITLRCAEITDPTDVGYDFRYGLAVDNQNRTKYDRSSPNALVDVEYSNGQKIYWSVRAKNTSAGSTAWSSNMSFTIDTQKPTINSISINSGASYTNTRLVTVSLSASGATWMMLSENENFSGASWVTYSTSKSKTLSSGDGSKTLYFKAKDSAVGDQGAAYPNINTSAKSATIYLDTTGPTVTEQSPSGGTTTTTEDLTVSATLSDTGAGVDTNNVTMIIDGTTVTPTDLTTSLCSYDMPTVSVGSHWVNVTAYDDIGNIGYENWTFTVTTDSGDSPSTGPGSSTPVVETTKTITLSRSPSGTITSSDEITITATLANFGSIVSVDLLYSIDDEDYDESISMTESSSTVYTATIGEFSESSTVYYKVKVIDSDDTTTRSSSESFTVQDNNNPTFKSVSPSNGSSITNAKPEIKAIYMDPSGIDTSSVTITFNGEDVTANSTVTATSVSYTPTEDLTYSTYTVTVEITDNSDNSATKTWSFSVIAVTTGITEEIEDIKADEPVQWENTDTTSAVGQIEITSSKDLGKITLSITTTGSAPGEVQVLPTDSIYMYMEIETNATSDISNAKINFKITKQWIEDNNIALSSVKLLRYTDNQWESLDTSKVDEDDTYYYFEAVTTGFSVFAITGKQIEDTVEPPFPILYLVIIIIVAILLIIVLLFKSGFLVVERTEVTKPTKPKKKKK